MKQKFRIQNSTDRVIKVVIEPLWEEMDLNPKDEVFIDMNLTGNAVTRSDLVTIDFDKDMLIIWEEDKTGFEFSDPPADWPSKPPG